MTVKENGKAVVDIVRHSHRFPSWSISSPVQTTLCLSLSLITPHPVFQKYADLPVQLATSTAPLKASVVLASFGSSQGLNTPVFSVTLKTDPNATPLVYEKPLRYGKRELIHHTFRADPKNPPKIISAFFSLAVLATVPVLFVGVRFFLISNYKPIYNAFPILRKTDYVHIRGLYYKLELKMNKEANLNKQWLALGANVSHLQSALRNAPIAHGVFFGSLVALEGVFYLYYVSWTLFEVLPIIGVVGAATFLSGVKALSEVQSRRLAGER